MDDLANAVIIGQDFFHEHHGLFEFNSKILKLSSSLTTEPLQINYFDSPTNNITKVKIKNTTTNEPVVLPNIKTIHGISPDINDLQVSPQNHL